MSKKGSMQIGRRYAEALFEVVSPQDRSAVSEEFGTLSAVLQDPEVKRVFFHPLTPIRRKAELIRLMGFSKPMEHFLLLVVEKSREQFLTQIIEEFKALVLKSRQITVAEVVSAVPLTAETVAEIRRRLEALSGKQVTINKHVDPKIGGGLIIKMDGEIIDGSVARSLQQFRSTLNF